MSHFEDLPESAPASDAADLRTPAELAGADEPNEADRRRMARRRRTLAIAAVVTVLAVACGFVAIGWASATQGEPGGRQQTPDSVDEPAAADADPAAAEAAEAAEAAAASAEGAAVELDWASLSPAVAAQMQHVQANWQQTESAEFGYLDENDCVNFASQSLLMRGWVEDDEWWYAAGDAYSSSTAWRSSTAFMEYLAAHPEKATLLTDDQRGQVRVGDIVQFDWDDSGDRDHTGIVTAILTNDDGSIDVRYAGHTDATWDRSVDEAITELHPGGVATYWSIAD